jgi:hypothetical protein
MTPQDNLNTANELGCTIAKLIAQSYGLSTNTAKVVDNLVAAMADKAQQLLNPPLTKSASTDDIVLAAGDTATIHGTGEVELVRSGVIDYIGPGATAISHASDCATNNRGVPELLGPCDCMGDVAKFADVPAGPTLQSYFEGELARGVIDFSLRACRLAGGDGSEIGFYLHPAQTSGETAQFTINGNTLTTHLPA